MSENTTIRALLSAKAPAPIGPYSQAVQAGDWVFCSGQIGLDPATGEMVAGGVIAEARRALCNLEAVLAEAGLAFADVVKTTIYLVRMDDFAAVNEVYAEFAQPPFPARATVAVVALPRAGRVEIDAVARRR